MGPIEKHLTDLHQELAEGTDSPIAGQRSAVRLSRSPPLCTCPRRGRKENKDAFPLLCVPATSLPPSEPKVFSLRWNIGLGWRMHSLSELVKEALVVLS